MSCPRCNGEVGPSDQFCTFCGTRLMAPPSDGAGAISPGSLSHSAAGSPGSQNQLRFAIIALLYLTLFGLSAGLAYGLLHHFKGTATPTPDLILGTPVQLKARVDAQPALLPASLSVLLPASPTDKSGPATVRPRLVAPRTKLAPPAGHAAAVPSTTIPGVATAASAAVSADLAVFSRDMGSMPANMSPAEQSAPDGGPAVSSSGAGLPLAPPESRSEPTAEDFDAQSVKMVVQHHLPLVRACYDRAVKQNPSLKGVVEIQFEIATDGTPRAAQVVRNTTEHSGLGLCLAGLFPRWRFPRPAGKEVIFVYPFYFSPGE
jgi:hypothetical protein